MADASLGTGVAEGTSGPGRYLARLGLRGGVAYVPGSGVDPAPLQLFAECSHLTTVVYADGGIERWAVIEMLRVLKGWSTGAPEPLEPGHFSMRGWQDFGPADPRVGDAGMPERSFAMRSVLLDERGRRLQFYFLGTEGTGMFRVLLRARLTPRVVVLRDHAGGRWRPPCGGDSALYRSARDLRAMPQLLLTAGGTQAWPGYRSASAPGSQAAGPDRHYEFYAAA